MRKGANDRGNVVSPVHFDIRSLHGGFAYAAISLREHGRFRQMKSNKCWRSTGSTWRRTITKATARIFHRQI